MPLFIWPPFLTGTPDSFHGRPGRFELRAGRAAWLMRTQQVMRRLMCRAGIVEVVADQGFAVPAKGCEGFMEVIDVAGISKVPW